MKFSAEKKARLIITNTDPSGRAVYGVGLRPLACWDCGFEFRRGHGCLSLVSDMWCQVEVSASGWSLVQRSPTKCGVSECDREASIMRRSWPTRGWCDMEEKTEKSLQMFVVLYSVWHIVNICCVVQLPELSTILGYTCFMSRHALHTVLQGFWHKRTQNFSFGGGGLPLR